MNVFTLLAQTARRHPRLPAVCEGERTLQSWRELELAALRVAVALREVHARGDRIAIFSENQPAYVQTLFGIWAAGMVAVPINYKLHPREAQAIIEDAGAATVFISKALAPVLQPLLATGSRVHELGLVEAGSGTGVVADGGCGDLADRGCSDVADVDPDDLAWLFFTSGTTGRSKGAMLSHRNLMAMTIAHLADIEAFDEHCSQLHGAPLSHGSGIYLLPSAARGARQVIPASHGFDPAEFLALCDHHPGCGAFLAPTMVQRLRLHLESTGGNRPAGLRSIVYGGAPMYVEDLRRSLAVFGPILAQIYGQGEAPMTITGLPRSAHVDADVARLGSVGYARSGVEVRVVGGDGRDLAPGAIGEVIVRGDVVMQGYWRNAAATAAALKNGWLWTGDMGSLDQHGYLTLRDRSKDLIISGGSNIYPREVEEALLTHPDVLEASVIGRPDRDWGEVVMAFIVPRPGVACTDAADLRAFAARLDAHCLARIARFKRPRKYRIVAALPKNSYGKVLKRELRTLPD
jgi:acyl-CoA synthetase (AMP-forming)/AMP-acid ligase II